MDKDDISKRQAYTARAAYRFIDIHILSLT